MSTVYLLPLAYTIETLGGRIGIELICGGEDGASLFRYGIERKLQRSLICGGYLSYQEINQQAAELARHQRGRGEEGKLKELLVQGVGMRNEG